MIRAAFDLCGSLLVLTLLRLRGVRIHWRTAFSIRGIPFISNRGTFVIAEGVRINARYSANPIGGQHFCSFVVGPGALLEIQEGAAISNSAFVCCKKITVGKYVYIGGDCRIFDTDFHSLELGKRIGLEGPDVYANVSPVVLKRGAFIGAGSTILKGVTVGEESVVGAGSVVTKSIPDKQVWAGNPAQFVKHLKPESRGSA